MRRIATALLCMLALLAPGALAGPSPGGYPQLCTDSSSLTAASNSEYMTCAELKSGSSTTYPGYTRVQDGNGTTLADVFPWSTATTGTSVRGLATLGVVGFVAGGTWTQAIAGAGAVTDGTQRVTLASDDPAVANLADIETEILKNPWSKLDDDETANCVAITNASVDYDFSSTMTGWTAGDWICMSADGNMAYLNCGAAPTATTSIGGFSIKIPSGASRCRRLTGPVCAVIGTTTAGTICFEHLDSDL